MSTPAADGFTMPAEWAPHTRCWMAWPCRAETFGGALAEARRAYADVARAIAAFEPVTMVCNPSDVAEASIMCGGTVDVLPIPLDDSWMRDIGPTFVTNGRGGIAGVDWRFNAWGGKSPDVARDQDVARRVLERLSLPRYEAPFVLEGGAIHVDGEGTVLATEQCLLNPNRNPGLTKAEIEDLLRAYLGVHTVIWLGEGYEQDETDGHVDEIACFVKPGTVLVLTTEDTGDPNYRIFHDNLKRLAAAKDAQGRDLDVVTIRQPERRDHKGVRLTLSYINFYIANGGVVMPAFEDPADDEAYRALRRLFPRREVVQVPVLDIVRGGGGIHCITQQQPVA